LDNFVAGRSRDAVAAVAALAEGTGPRVVALWGTLGTGKTHLLAACCRASGTGSGDAAFIPLGRTGDKAPPALYGLEGLPLVCLDDIDRVAGQMRWEKALLSFYELAEQAAVRLLIASRVKPHVVGFALPDLRSRLASAAGFRLHDLDDDERIEALERRARERGFRIPPEVARYILERCARDMHSLMGLVDRLDRSTLVAQQHVTIPFVRQLLLESEPEGRT
jgi:DnaA family protein